MTSEYQRAKGLSGNEEERNEAPEGEDEFEEGPLLVDRKIINIQKDPFEVAPDAARRDRRGAEEEEEYEEDWTGSVPSNQPKPAPGTGERGEFELPGTVSLQ